MPDERRTQHVTLGCGTLILIALIVMIFSNSSTSDIRSEVRALQSDITELKEAVKSQTNEIRRLHDGVSALQRGTAGKPKTES